MSFLPSFLSPSRTTTGDNDPLLFFSSNPASEERNYHKWTIYTFLTDLLYILRLSGIFIQPGRHRWAIFFCILGQILWYVVLFCRCRSPPCFLFIDVP